MRGEYGVTPVLLSTSLGSPPLARGIPSSIRGVNLTLRITPACAGNTEVDYVRITRTGDHPRLRGEYHSDNRLPADVKGSPPLARGIPRNAGGTDRPEGITPACAGNTRCHLEVIGQKRDHPRLRGEYMPSSPLTK